MNLRYLFGSSRIVVSAESIDEAGAGLRAALAIGPKVRTIWLLFDPTSNEVMPWLESAKAASPEIRGLMVQRFFARVLTKAGYNIVVGRELDIFARCRLRSLFIEVKSSLAGGRFGSQADISQLDGYVIACQRNGAERWLGTMGITKPMNLHDTFRAAMRRRNIGLIDIRWVSAKETLLPHLPSIP
jgi:hypothetical protein